LGVLSSNGSFLRDFGDFLRSWPRRPVKLAGSGPAGSPPPCVIFISLCSYAVTVAVKNLPRPSTRSVSSVTGNTVSECPISTQSRGSPLGMSNLLGWWYYWYHTPYPRATESSMDQTSKFSRKHHYLRHKRNFNRSFRLQDRGCVSGNVEIHDLFQYFFFRQPSTVTIKKSLMLTSVTTTVYDYLRVDSQLLLVIVAGSF
jgi:hypothetical protein